MSPGTVITGSAVLGDAACYELAPTKLMSCSVVMRLRTLSCATIKAPVLPKASLPPV